MDDSMQQDFFVNTFLQHSRSQSNPISSSNPPFKKRLTTSPPPEEVASCAPPRLSVLGIALKDQDSQDRVDPTLQNRILFTPPQSPTPFDHHKRSIESITHERQDDIICCPKAVLKDAVDEDTVMANSIDGETTSQAAALPARPPATLTTLPPELTLHLLKYMSLDVHSKLYETNKHFHNTILQNDAYLYSKKIARAGSNPRGESSLARAIFAFQYTDKPRKQIDPIVDLNSDEEEQDMVITSDIQYLSKFAHLHLGREFG